MGVELILTTSGIAGNAGTPLNRGGCTLTVPALKYWEPTAVHIKYVACASAGNRVVEVTFGVFGAYTAGQVLWEPVVAANQTRYFDSYIALPSRATYINTDHAIAPMPPGMIFGPDSDIIPTDLVSITDDGDFTYDVSTIDSITATTVVATSTPYPDNYFAGATLYMGASTAVITANTTGVLTFAGGWVGGTPDPANYYVWFDTMEFTLAYNEYVARSG